MIQHQARSYQHLASQAPLRTPTFVSGPAQTVRLQEEDSLLQAAKRFFFRVKTKEDFYTHV